MGRKLVHSNSFHDSDSSSGAIKVRIARLVQQFHKHKATISPPDFEHSDLSNVNQFTRNTMAKKAKNNESPNLLAESGRRTSKRSKSIPTRFKETTFQEALLKRDMQRNNTTTTKNRKVKRNKQEDDRPQQISNPKLRDHIVEKDTITTAEEEEYLLQFKRRKLGKIIISDEEDEAPVKRRRLKKRYQKSNIADEEEEIWSSKTENKSINENSGNPLKPQSSKNSKDKKGHSAMRNKTLQQSHYCLIDEEEDKDYVSKDKNEWMEEINKSELQDKEGNSYDNENTTNQRQDVIVINDEIQHEENGKKIVPINSLDAQSNQQWTIKVRVIRRGAIEQYSGTNGSGSFWKVILMDNHGTSIMSMAFNQAIDSMEQRLIKGRTYFISNADAKPINKTFKNVHDSLEIRLTEQTVVEEAIQPVQLEHLSYSAIPFSNLDEHAMKEDLVDVFGLLFKVDQIKTVTKRTGGTVAMRTITLIDESSKSISITLWGDLAQNEGTELEEIEDQKPVVGAFKVKSSFYKGQINLSAIATATILINPPLPEAKFFTKRHNKDGDHKERRLVGHEIRNIQPTSALQTKQKIKIEKN